MKLAINTILILVVLFLAYLLYVNIQEPIKFQGIKEARKNAVVDKLMDIRTGQEIFRDITGKYASDFDTLIHVLAKDSIPKVRIEEDPTDPSNEDLWKTVTTYSSAKDSLDKMEIDISSLRYVPFTDKQEFNIEADTLTYQKTLVSVVQVGTRWKNFMGEYADPKFAKYDGSYDPDRVIKFGDMNKPSTGGNWE